MRDTGVAETIYDIEVRPGGRHIENFLAGSGGVFVSNTAGFVDAGWDGHLTLELSNVANLPIALYPGMKIGQISFLRMTTPPSTRTAATHRFQVPGPTRPDAVPLLPELPRRRLTGTESVAQQFEDGLHRLVGQLLFRVLRPSGRRRSHPSCGSFSVTSPAASSLAELIRLPWRGAAGPSPGRPRSGRPALVRPSVLRASAALREKAEWWTPAGGAASLLRSRHRG